MIVVTGTTGNVGSAVVAQLIDSDHDIRAATRDPERAAARLPANVEIVQADLSSSDGL